MTEDVTTRGPDGSPTPSETGTPRPGAPSGSSGQPEAPRTPGADSGDADPLRRVEHDAARDAEVIVRRTRASGVWTSLVVAAVVLVFLLIFIVENNHDVAIHYLGTTSRLPLGVGLLFAAVGGALVVIVAGAARILQLRHAARRHRRMHKTPTG